MKLTIFGSTGKTGKQLCRIALQRGHQVVAYARDASKLDEFADDLTVLTGDLENRAAIQQALQSADIAISALGTVDRKRNTVLSDGTRLILDIAKECGVNRFAAITSLGCGDSKSQVNSLIMRFVIKSFAKEIWADKERQEDVIGGSGLDYLILRPGGLTDKPARGTWTELRSGERAKGRQMIPRADVAAYILDRVQQPEFGNDCVVVF